MRRSDDNDGNRIGLGRTRFVEMVSRTTRGPSIGAGFWTAKRCGKKLSILNNTSSTQRIISSLNAALFTDFNYAVSSENKLLRGESDAELDATALASRDSIAEAFTLKPTTKPFAARLHSASDSFCPPERSWRRAWTKDTNSGRERRQGEI